MSTHQARIAVIESDGTTWHDVAQDSWSGLNRRTITAAVPAGKVLSSTTIGIEVQLPSPLPLYGQGGYVLQLLGIGLPAAVPGVQQPDRFQGRDREHDRVPGQRLCEQPGCGLGRHDAGTARAANGRDRLASSGATYNVRFRTTPAVGKSLWLQTEGSFATPASISIRTATGLSAPAGGADTVIVRTVVLYAPRPRRWRPGIVAHGRRTVIADLQDVYDEFNYGIRHPVAVRQMMTWAASQLDRARARVPGADGGWPLQPEEGTAQRVTRRR